MKNRLGASLAGVLTVLAIGGPAAANVTAATATNCGGKTNAQLVSGDTVTVNLTLDRNTGPGFGTALSSTTGFPFYSNIDSRSWTSGVPQVVTYTLTQTPPGGLFNVTDGFDAGVPLTCPAAPAPAAIPTLTEWAMILMSMLLAGLGALFVMRRRIV